jgi:GTP-binding protein
MADFILPFPVVSGSSPLAMRQNTNIRNIAIIAHVDHGKTTLVDELFKQSGLFRENQAVNERIMDSMDLERERGITISAKNCSVVYNGVKINIIDTPGHADFGGEVERSLTMVDGVILLVDSAEGPLPQTRFVLEKALKKGLKVIVVLNKIDRGDARPEEVLHDIYDLFIDIGADEEQIEFPVYYAIGRDGIAKKTLEEEGKDLKPLFDSILSELPSPTYDDDEPFQMLVCNIGYSDYTGSLAIGRVMHGSAKTGEPLVCIHENGNQVRLKVSKLEVYQGIQQEVVELVEPGEIVILSGVDSVQIGDTICHEDRPKAFDRITVDEPTVAMRFMTNTSPFAGKEGTFVQSARIWDRLQKETLYNVAIQVDRDPSGEAFLVKGRGEFQLAVLIETMRREGYELAVGKPQILFKEEGGKTLEPMEHVVIDVDSAYTGVVTEKLGRRRGQMQNMDGSGSRTRLEFRIPSRGLIGFRNDFLTDTKGTGILSSYLDGYEELKGDVEARVTGSLVADRQGNAVAYGLWYLEERGEIFITPGDPVYDGMIIGEHARDNDLMVNPTRSKKLTNMRTTSKDDAVTLTPVQPMTLERAIEFIKDDELVEVTPKSIRLRKAVLDVHARKSMSKKG